MPCSAAIRKPNREAIIAANPSLSAEPLPCFNRGELTGIPAAVADQSAEALPVVKNITSEPSADRTSQCRTLWLTADVHRELKYTAQHGDSVSALAANLLGGDTMDNRKVIIDGNASLQGDSNRLVAGKTYTISDDRRLNRRPSRREFSIADYAVKRR